MKKFEVELRALISKEKYSELLKIFSKMAIGQLDNTKTYTFLTPKINIKVKDHYSRKFAKITVKNGAEYRQQANETELEIDPMHIKNAIALITSLGFEKHIPSYQKRINFRIQGIDVSLKYEPNWKHHVEAEIMVKKESEIKKAKVRLNNFFKSYDLKPTSEKELKTLINSFIEKYGMKKI